MKKLLSPWWALLTLSALVYMFASPPAFLQSVRLNYFDQLIVNQEPVENNIYVAEIDEATLNKYGQYPFPRNIYSDIIKELYEHNAGLVVWNVMMPEIDRLGGDAELAETMLELPVVLASRPSNTSKNEPINPGAVIVNSEYLNVLLPYGGIIANIPELENNSVGAGIVSTEPEIDGVVRRMPTVAVVNGTLYPSLALETLRVVAGDTNFQIKLQPNGVEKMRIPKFGVIPTDNEGRVWIDWSQRNKNVSVVNLPEDFGGAVVIVDVTASGIANPVPTAMGSQYAGTTQATVLGTMFNGSNIQRPDWAPMVELIALGVAGLILILVSRWMVVGLVLTVVSIVAVIPYSMYVYTNEKILLDATAPIITLVIIALQVYGIKFVVEFLQKQQIKKQFGTYLSPALVEKLQKNPELLQLGGERRELSIMFTDVRGFTAISEHYGDDVEGLTSIMNRYMTAMTKRIIDNNGTVDKYIGDAQMAFWNAPVDDEHHAFNAVRTGLDMIEDLKEFNKEITAEGHPPFAMGLGINTDTVIVGNMGSDQRFDYTCLGDGVNLGARIEGQTKTYGVDAIIGENTMKQVHHEFTTLQLDCIAVKGKKVGVNIYTVIRGDWGRKFDHDDMMNMYFAQNFKGAIKMCESLKGYFDGQLDGYYNIWIERCKGMKVNKEWDGVYRPTTK